MNRKVSCLAALLFAFVFTWALSAQTVDPLAIIPGEKIPGTVKRGEALELQRTALGGTSPLYPWVANPALYGFTPPPDVAITYPSEGENTSGVIVSWPIIQGGAFQYPEVIEIIRAGVQQGVTTNVVLTQAALPLAQARLTSAGIDVDQVTFVVIPIDTIWLRDYGPDIMLGDDGAYHIMDMSYYPQIWASPTQPRGRVNDDALPTRLADMWGASAHRPPFAMEGGNIQSDGNGTCFASNRILQINGPLFGYSEDRVREILAQYYNCQELVILEQLGPDRVTTCREGTGHIDMYMTFIYPNTILVGQADPTDEPTNAPLLDRNAQRLADLTDADGNPRYDVRRIPMPKPYYLRYSPPCFRECATQPDPCISRVWATYANSTQVGNAMLVPFYRYVPPAYTDIIMAQEQQAMSMYQQVAPDLDLVMINADTIIPGDGAIHCINKTYQ